MISYRKSFSNITNIFIFLFLKVRISCKTDCRFGWFRLRILLGIRPGSNTTTQLSYGKIKRTLYGIFFIMFILNNNSFLLCPKCEKDVSCSVSQCSVRMYCMYCTSEKKKKCIAGIPQQFFYELMFKKQYAGTHWTNLKIVDCPCPKSILWPSVFPYNLK